MSAQEFAAKYGNRKWGRFAKETVDKFVFGSRGLSYYDQSLPYLPLYLKIEKNITPRVSQSQNRKTNQIKKKDLGR